MSLISDSLKRASEERTVTGGPSPVFNLVGFGEGDNGAGFSWGRFLVLIVLPAAVLGGLLYIGTHRQITAVFPKNEIPTSVAKIPSSQENEASATQQEKPKKAVVAGVSTNKINKSASATPVPAKTPDPLSTRSEPVKKVWPVDKEEEEEEQGFEPVRPVALLQKKNAEIPKEKIAVSRSIAEPTKKVTQKKKKPAEKPVYSSSVRVKRSKPKPEPNPKHRPRKETVKVAVVSTSPNSKESNRSASVKSGMPNPMPEKPVTNQTPQQDAEFYFKMGVFYQLTEDHFEALEYYNKALQLDPTNAETYNNRSLIYKELGKPDRAVRGFLKAIQLDPGYVKAYNNIGLLYYEKNNFAAAESSFEKAISIDPQNLESYNNLAIVYKNQKNRVQARELYQAILKKNPEHIEAHYNLALLYEEEGDYPHAIEHYQRFVDLGPTRRPELVSKVRKHLQLLK